MDIKQLIEDVKLRAKNDRRVWAVLGLAFFAIVLWNMSSDGRKTKRVRPGIEIERASNQVPGGNEAYEDLMKYLADDLKNTQAAIKQQAEITDRIQKESRAQNEKLTGVITEVVNRIEMMDDAVKKIEQTRSEQQQDYPSSTQVASQQQLIDSQPDELEVIGGGEPTAALPPPPIPPQLSKRTFISPGDAVPIRLLTGVAAPVDGTPYPVMFKVMGAISGPDGSSLDLGEARLVAAAQGSETDGRVVYRLSDLAFRNPDGRRSVIKVDGWVVGEDGIRGMRGKVIDKLGQVILATMAYSATAAAGDAVSMRYRNNFLGFRGNRDINLTGTDLNMAAASALTDGSVRITQMLLDKYEKLVPVVEVNSGRDVVAVFSRGAEVSVYDEEEEGGIYSASLD